MENENGGEAPAPEDQGAVAETQAENLSGNELVAKLLERRTGGANQSEEEAETTEETVGEPESEEIPETVGDEQQEEPASETLATDGTDVLSKYGINLDELPPEEAEALAKQLGSRAVKRFGRLTGQKKELQERLEALERRYDETVAEKDKQIQRAGKKTKISDDSPLHGINTIDELEDRQTQLRSLIDWAGDQLHNEPQWDDEGNEYLVESDGQKYTKQDLLEYRERARREMSDDHPIRKKWIRERQEFDGLASQNFNWLDNQEDTKTQFFHQMKSLPEYSSFVETIPAGNFALGLMAIGWEVFNSKENGGQKKKSAPTGKPPVAATPQSAKPKQMAGRMTDLQKRIQEAEQRFQRTGNQNDLIALRKLKVETRGA